MTKTVEQLPQTLRNLYNLKILNDLDIYLTETLNRRYAANNASELALLACALSSRVVSDGHVCLDIKSISSARVSAMASARMVTQKDMSEETAALCNQLANADETTLINAGHGLIGDADATAPIVIAKNHIYIRRYWKYETLVARKLKKMATTSQAVNNKAHEEIEERITSLKLEGKKREAAISAMRQKLTIISGGPGTGKTYVAARIIHLLLNSTKSDGKLPIVRMAAPTGKAADAIDKSLRDAMTEIGNNDNQTTLLPASTIDRLLGYKHNSPYFKHDTDNPLVADIVLIDEASMIDLPKMAKILDALDDNCRLILLGDMYQLASVAPGSIMADICSAEILKNCITELTESRRFKTGSPVDLLAKAVNTVESVDDASTAWILLQSLNDDKFGNQRIITHEVPDSLSDHGGNANIDLAISVINGYKEFTDSESPAEAFNALKKFRILCALRNGPHGVNALNEIVENILTGKAIKPASLPEKLQKWRRITKSVEFYSHRIIMITRNDYSMNLFNGDIGVVLPDDNNPENLIVWFEGKKDGEPLRKIPGRLLPEHQTAFATTIHKSQGSEFEQTMVILPQHNSKILTKELVYTAITRTKRGIQFWCNEDVFKEAVKQKVERSSGLLGQLDNSYL